MTELDLEAHRRELLGYCYRMLGSPFDAEDAVQETLLRAWRNASRFDPARAPLRGWLFAIATNVCLDHLRTARRRARPVDLTGPSAPGAALGVPYPDPDLVFPAPDGLVLAPEDLVVRRDTVRLAFIAALQALPPRQRSVLILRDVLAFSAAEAASLLSTSVAAVNSALQRARSTLSQPVTAQPIDESLLRRYVEAFTANDISALVSVLHEDATMSMPPLPFWLRGRSTLLAAMSASGACADASLVRCGASSFIQYRGGRPFAVVVLEAAPPRFGPSSPSPLPSAAFVPPSPLASASSPPAPRSSLSAPSGSALAPAGSPLVSPADPMGRIGHITTFLNNPPLLELFARHAGSH
ncbi:RNA polymerase subunit sigma-70 [Dactylosporangium sp. CA-139066]|uniref:RNA polymerase subunit sigma-70 n=1 Tax=Dactylosporangium sp. CA-139066 TaxID=3239930 RepID=UPI003D9099C3